MLASVVLLTVIAGDLTPIHLTWKDNFLTLQSTEIPGGVIRIHYLEAYCRSGSTDRDWRQTIFRHQTRALTIEPAERGRCIRLQCKVTPGVTVEHLIRSTHDEVSFDLTARNTGPDFVDVQWAQPCIRVDKFTGLGQDDYYRRCFIFLDRGLVTLDLTARAHQARYVPGQVYVPRGIDRNDVNPRPQSKDVPANGLIGCFSADSKKIFASAWAPYQELFQGVIVCIHSDFRIGGLKAGETKKIRGKIYLVDNDIPALLARYTKDFGGVNR